MARPNKSRYRRRARKAARRRRREQRRERRDATAQPAGARPGGAGAVAPAASPAASPADAPAAPAVPVRPDGNGCDRRPCLPALRRGPPALTDLELADLDWMGEDLFDEEEADRIIAETFGVPDKALTEALLDVGEVFTLGHTAEAEAQGCGDECVLMHRAAITSVVWNAYTDAGGDLGAVDLEAAVEKIVEMIGLPKPEVEHLVRVLLRRRAERWGGDFRRVGLTGILPGPGGKPKLQAYLL